MNDEDRKSELIEDWLITFEDALARSVEPPEPPELIRDDPRLIGARLCIERLEVLLPSPTTEVDWEDPSVRKLAAGHTPETIGRFEIIREIGRGGCGLVYLAFDPILGREIALKVPRPEMLLSAEMRQRFLREAQAAASLNHDGIIAIHETGEAGSLAFITAAYCSGPSLSKWLNGRSNVPIPSAVRLIVQVAEAVQHAHDRGILHRDIKPSNILLQPIGIVTDDTLDLDQFSAKITDFGLARILDFDSFATRTGQVLGTPTYMSPEQGQGHTELIGPASDVYSIGVVLFEILTGQPPFVGGSDIEVLRQVINEDPPMPRTLRRGLPADLEAICLKCLEKSPSRRYQTATALSEDLQRYLSGKPTIARPLNQITRTIKWMKRHPSMTGLLSLASFSLTAFIIFISIYSARLGTLNASLEQTNEQLRTEKELALERGRQLRLRTYADQIRLATRHLDANELNEVRRILDSMKPEEGEEDLREFVWHHLHHEIELASQILKGHTDEVYQLAYSPDGRTLASSSKDHSIRLWDAITGESIGTLDGHTNEVNGLLFTPDGKFLYSASDDKTIRYWNIRTKEYERVLTGHEGIVTELTLLPDGKTLVSAGGDQTLRYWTAESDRPLDTIRFSESMVHGVLDPLGRFGIVGTPSHQVEWWDLVTKKKLYTHPTPTPVKRTGLMPDGKFAIVSLHGGEIRLMQPEMSDRHLITNAASTSMLRGSPDGRYVLLATVEGRIIVCDTERPDNHFVLHAHADRVWDIVFSPDGRQFSSCGADGVVKIWDWETVLAQEQVTIAGKLRGGTFLGPDSWLALADDSLGVEVWDHRQMRLLLRAFSGPATELLAFSPLRRNLIVSENRTHTVRELILSKSIESLSLATGLVGSGAMQWVRSELPQLTPHALNGHNALSMVLAPDNRLLAVGTTHGEIFFFDEPEGTLRHVLTIPEQSFQASIAFHPSLPILACRGERGEVRFWNWKLRKYVARFEANRHEVSAMSFSPDGAYLATGGSDAVVLIWDWRNGEIVRRMAGHRERVTSLAFSPDGKTLATGSNDRSLRFWQVATGNELLNITDATGRFPWIAFHEDGKTFVGIRSDSGNNRSTIHILRGD